MNNELSYEQRLDLINSKATSQIDTLHNNFNKIKNEMLNLNREYEKNNKQRNDEVNLKPLQDELIKLLTEETKENQSYIIEKCRAFDNGIEPLLNEQNKEKEDMINNYTQIYNQISEHLNSLTQQIDMVKTGRDQTQSTLIEEMNKEFNHCFSIQKCEDNRNECLTAIQNMLRIISGQFKDHQKEKRDFEEKIIFLLEDLCKKMHQIK